MRLNVVLYEPEIPQNTGNIMRTCVASNAMLHLIKPLGFDIENPKFRRFTTNHITWADYKLYDNYESFLKENEGEFFYMTRYGKKSHTSFDYSSIPSDVNIYLVFGKESTGIPYHILKDNLDRCYRIPMAPECRALNVSNAVAISVYETQRQLGFEGLSIKEIQKGEDFLESYDEALIK